MLFTGLLYRAVGKRVADGGLDPDDPADAFRAAVALTPAELDNPSMNASSAKPQEACSQTDLIR